MFSIDIETLGSDHSAPIIQIGAAVFDVDDKPGVMIDTIEFMLLKKVFHNVEPYAAAMNSKILAAIAGTTYFDALEGDVVNYEDAAEHLGEWMKKYDSDPVTVCGKNFSSFDLPKLKKLPGWDEHVPRIHHRSPDPGSLYWMREDGDVLPSMQKCMERAGMGGIVAHTAQEDAVVVATLIQIEMVNR